MQAYQNVVQDTSGNVVTGVSIAVYLAGTTTPASIFSDNAYTALSNPFTNATDGSYKFYAGDGRYDVVPSKAGSSFVAADTSAIVLDDPASLITPAQITSNQNDYNPTNALNARTWRLSSDATRNITGIAAGKDGQIVILSNVGSFSIVVQNENAGSAAANRITSGTDVSLSPNSFITLAYDATTARWRVASTTAPITGVLSVVGGELLGLTLSNDGGDPVNNIGIATGDAASDDSLLVNRTAMSLTSPLIKKLNSTWVVGTNQGMLDTGSVANAVYHVFLIKRTDTGVVDVLASLSPTAPTMPTNYTKKRRIGSILREAGTITAFVHSGDTFRWVSPTMDGDIAVSGTTANTVALHVPTGLPVRAFGYIQADNVTHGYISPLNVTDLAVPPIAAPAAPLFETISPVVNQGTVFGPIFTDTAASIRVRVNITAHIRLSTHGWIDSRGRDA